MRRLTLVWHASTKSKSNKAEEDGYHVEQKILHFVHVLLYTLPLPRQIYYENACDYYRSFTVHFFYFCSNITFQEMSNMCTQCELKKDFKSRFPNYCSKQNCVSFPKVIQPKPSHFYIKRMSMMLRTIQRHE